MNKQVPRYDIAIAGGGLAGLAASILLARRGFQVILLEKKQYPFHRVCGEYVSEESRPFLSELGIPFSTLELPEIRKLVLSAPNGRRIDAPLDMGGFGISRYKLDALLAGIARSEGVHLMEGAKVQNIQFENELAIVTYGDQELKARLALGSFGKRANLDMQWQRKFALEKAGGLNNFIGIKYHISIEEPTDTIALHNFKDGYCGMSAIEDGLFCFCYLTRANNLVNNNYSVAQLEEMVLRKNPHLAQVLDRAVKRWDKPLSISQVSFAPKSLVHEHVLMVGDAAGMITPLCGNGMSMALHAAKLVVEEATVFLKGGQSRTEMENNYSRNWKRQFSGRLRAGRMIQRFFGDEWITGLLVGAAARYPSLANFLIRQTHGEPF